MPSPDPPCGGRYSSMPISVRGPITMTRPPSHSTRNLAAGPVRNLVAAVERVPGLERLVALRPDDDHAPVPGRDPAGGLALGLRAGGAERQPGRQGGGEHEAPASHAIPSSVGQRAPGWRRAATGRPRPGVPRLEFTSC